MPQLIDRTEKELKLYTATRSTNLGICTTCNHAPDCVNVKASSQPIWHCDQFDDYVAPDEKAVPQATKEPDVPEAQSFSTNGVHKSLCFNCSNRHDCVNMTLDVPKLYCEQYC